MRLNRFERARRDELTPTALCRVPMFDAATWGRQGFALDPAAGFRALPELLAEADVVSLHVPLTGETARMIAAALARVKPSAILVNTAPCGLVDKAALLGALSNVVIALPTASPTAGTFTRSLTHAAENRGWLAACAALPHRVA